MNNKNQITIKDVAKRAGVSVATAGRVMGNYGNTAEETREKVLKAAEELNYVPNQLAQGMRSQSSKTIAVVVPDIRNNFFGNIVAAMELRAREKGYSTLICNTGEQRPHELECLEMLASKQVDGILLASSFSSKEEIPKKYIKTIFNKIPIVTYDRKLNGFPFVSIVTDNYNMGYQTAKYLIGLGHSDIVTIGAERNGMLSSTVQERESGYRAAILEAGLSYGGLSINVDLSNPADTEKKINILLDYHKVTAVIVFNNSIFGPFVNILNARNLHFPRDLSIITWDDEDYDEFLDITAVRQPGKKMGELAVMNLIEQIETPNYKQEDLTITLNQTIITRGSCRINNGIDTLSIRCPVN